VASSQEFSKARAGNGGGLFQLEFPESEAAARHGATSPERTLPERRKRAAVRTSMTPKTLAGARERDGTRRGMKATSARGPLALEGYGFAPEMIVAPCDHAADLIRHCEPRVACMRAG
jgi:hypothetical protein